MEAPGAGGAGGVLIVMHGRTAYGDRPSHPYYLGTEHVGFSPTRQTLLVAPKRAKRREAFGESHQERGAS